MAFACSLCVGSLLTPICLFSPACPVSSTALCLAGVCVLRAPPGPHRHLSSCAAGLPASLWASPACPRSWFLCCHCAVSGSHSSAEGAVISHFRNACAWVLCPGFCAPLSVPCIITLGRRSCCCHYITTKVMEVQRSQRSCWGQHSHPGQFSPAAGSAGSRVWAARQMPRESSLSRLLHGHSLLSGDRADKATMSARHREPGAGAT